MVLNRPMADGEFVVVCPEARIPWGPDFCAGVAGRGEPENLRVVGVNTGRLYNVLVDKNRRTTPLQLPSSSEDGYVFDYDGKFASYFKVGGGSWTKFYDENPEAKGWEVVSLPILGKSSHVVLIFRSMETQMLAGECWLLAYRFENGGLTPLDSVMVWIS